MSEENKLPTVSVELDAYDLMVLEDAIHRTEGQGWSSDESNDRAKVRDKLIEAYARLPPPPPLDLVESLGSPALSPLDVLLGLEALSDLNALLDIPSEYLHPQPLKVISAHQEGDTTILLLSKPLDYTSITGRLNETKISNNIEFCPLCALLLNVEGVCVNLDCPKVPSRVGECCPVCELPLNLNGMCVNRDCLKISDDTKPCPACEFILDANGECVNHRCPNRIREDRRIKE